MRSEGREKSFLPTVTLAGYERGDHQYHSFLTLQSGHDARVSLKELMHCESRKRYGQ